MVKVVKVVAFLVAGALLATQAVLALGAVYLQSNQMQLMVIIGNSMAPLYHVGDAVILDKNVDSIEVGDIVTFYDTDGKLTTHRVIAERTVEDKAHFQTQGDANTVPDPDLAALDAVIGMPLHHIPDGGRLIRFLNSKNGRLLTYGPALVLVIALEIAHAAKGWRGDEEPDDEQAHTQPAGSGTGEDCDEGDGTLSEESSSE